MAGTPYLLDSNILLRWVKPDHNDYPLVVSAIEAILRRDGEPCYTSQNVGEFWNTCTRLIDPAGTAVQEHQSKEKEKASWDQNRRMNKRNFTFKSTTSGGKPNYARHATGSAKTTS